MTTVETGTHNGQKIKSGAKLEAVRDTRNCKVRGLWKRGDVYYAQLRIDVGNGRKSPRRIRLDATNLRSARAALEGKRTEQRDHQLKPKHASRVAFATMVEEYLASPGFTEKKPRTQYGYRRALARWVAHVGGSQPVQGISLALIDNYRTRRVAAGTSARTVNLDIIALRQVLSYAKMRGDVDNVIQFFAPQRGGGLKALTHRPPAKRPLLTKEQFVVLLGTATDSVTKNSELLRFFLRFLAVSGAREQEALCVARADVDFLRSFVTIGARGDSKNSHWRTVDFSPELDALMLELEVWLPPETSWLFPSPQRGQKDIHAQTLRESFKLVRQKAGLQWLGFHDFRHFFASQCVMAGIDFMTIAAWLGHRDGGILVGKVYGHLADSHKKQAAQKLRFFQ
jgi:integrase